MRGGDGAKVRRSSPGSEGPVWGPRVKSGVRGSEGPGPADRTVAPSHVTVAPQTFAPSQPYRALAPSVSRDRNLLMLAREATPHEPRAGAFDVDVVDRRDVKRQQLRDQQTADHGESQWTP